MSINRKDLLDFNSTLVGTLGSYKPKDEKEILGSEPFYKKHASLFEASVAKIASVEDAFAEAFNYVHRDEPPIINPFTTRKGLENKQEMSRYLTQDEGEHRLNRVFEDAMQYATSPKPKIPNTDMSNAIAKKSSLFEVAYAMTKVAEAGDDFQSFMNRQTGVTPAQTAKTMAPKGTFDPGTPKTRIQSVSQPSNQALINQAYKQGGGYAGASKWYDAQHGAGAFNKLVSTRDASAPKNQLLPFGQFAAGLKSATPSAAELRRDVKSNTPITNPASTFKQEYAGAMNYVNNDRLRNAPQGNSLQSNLNPKVNPVMATVKGTPISGSNIKAMQPGIQYNEDQVSKYMIANRIHPSQRAAVRNALFGG